MYKYQWDLETGGVLLLPEQEKMSKEARPVYCKELDLLGFSKYYTYPKIETSPIMWAINNAYYYKGELIAKVKGGALFTAPKLEIVKHINQPLQSVDIKRMIQKNKLMLETIVQETIQDIYNIYIQYKNKVDIIYVAFSGGKDSMVVFDLVQKTLPHDDFKVIFGNTDMELPTTLDLVNQIEEICKNKHIDFLSAKSEFKAVDSWNLFGPPARRLRWCCSVHKSVPVLNKLHDILGTQRRMRTMMITGVRGDESDARSSYDKFSLGKKIAGQYSYHPILDWSSVEIYLYIFANNLFLNQAYRFGFNRVGCIVCPNSSARHEFIKNKIFPDDVKKFCDIIINSSKKDLSNGRDKMFLETGGWKMRVSGRELNLDDERICVLEEKDGFKFKIKKYRDTWIKWYRTMGELVRESENTYNLEYNGIWRKLIVELKDDNNAEIYVYNQEHNKNAIEFLSLFKSVMNKTLYCINCKLCEAECTMRNIHIMSGDVVIDDSCTKCKACLKINNGCIYYNSIKDSKGVKTMKGINRYLSVGVSGEWLKKYFSDSTYEPGNRKTDIMYAFLKDAGILHKKDITLFGDKIKQLGLNDDRSWALMLCNLVYTPAFGWYVKNIPFNQVYTMDLLDIDLGEETTKKAKGEFWNGFKNILHTMPYGDTFNFGIPDIETKVLRNGEERLSMKSIIRGQWMNPIPEVILYSLYKFSEACGDVRQFTLSSLLDDSIDRDGISPTRIFGIDRATMVPLLNGLNANYPEFISATFSLDLEEISLRPDKKAEDVLGLL